MSGNPILSLAIIFLLGFFSSRLISRLKIPIITGYVILGVIISPNFLNFVPAGFIEIADFFSNFVLGVIAFNLGESFSSKSIRNVGKVVTSISLSASLIPWFLVTLGLWIAMGDPFYIVLILGAISAATAPAATVAVVQEYKSKGRFTDILLGIVAIDDAWALIVFGLSLSLAKTFTGQEYNFALVANDLLKAILEIAASFALGAFVAFIFSRLSYLVNTSRERLIYVLGFLMLVVGVALFLNLSVLLSCMVFGAVLVNLDKMSFQFFESLREIDSPLYLIFFVLAGANLKLDVMGKALAYIVIFVLLRFAGKVIGSITGSAIVKAPESIKKYMGLALLPQAGISLGCALVAKNALNNTWGDLILSVTIGSTIIFELFGPWISRYALLKAGDIKE
ncbi:MAG: hypothetical protein GF375_01060 [Candidatus Omnitrophica bacterium]|nr:hypothetical protein [Candidatus Omnitrophota bacterium]MBD3268727.1 hypothetical protein [Candidatus Omnitrophota bacterium]